MDKKNADVKEWDALFQKDGNQLMVLYGGVDCRKEKMMKSFLKDKKYFYYRCRQLSAQEQLNVMSSEISRQFDVRMLKHTYDECFSRIKSGDGSKLVVVIDEVQYIMKRDPDFVKSLVKLKTKKLYPGPVMIILASSSIVWTEQDMEESFGENYKRIDLIQKIENLNFLEVVRAFPTLSVSECVKIYGCIGGVPGFMKAWNPEESFKENICRLVLTEGEYLFDIAQQIISTELRELSVYNTILSAIAEGKNKLNDLFLSTGFSRAKISVYIKNLSHFDIVEKVVSFETGGWENAKKGVYQIKDTFVNFWFKFVFPHLSELYLMEPSDFYDTYIAPDLGAYLNRYFRNVCMEYMMLLNQIGKVPFAIHKMGTWVGKTGNIDIIAQSTDRRNIVGLCNWEQPQLTMEMCEEMYENMQKAKISSEHFYLFSATSFEPDLIRHANEDPRFELIDMNEL